MAIPVLTAGVVLTLDGETGVTKDIADAMSLVGGDPNHVIIAVSEVVLALVEMIQDTHGLAGDDRKPVTVEDREKVKDYLALVGAMLTSMASVAVGECAHLTQSLTFTSDGDPELLKAQAEMDSHAAAAQQSFAETGNVARSAIIARDGRVVHQQDINRDGEVDDDDEDFVTGIK